MKTALLLFILTLSRAAAALPVSGRPVPSMTAFDDAMQDVMEENSVTAGVLGIMRNDRIVYLRAFGYESGNTPLTENALFRIASLCKPITAAAIRTLASAGAFGALGLQRPVFRLTVNGVDNNGLLNVTPWRFPGVEALGDPRLANITVEHLLHHAGGFRRDEPPGDPMFQSRTIAGQMVVASPPSRHNIMRWMLGQPLFWAPGVMDVSGHPDAYSNFGYMVLGEIIVAYSGNGYQPYLRSSIITPAMWVPSGEFTLGRSLLSNRHPREPLYSGVGFVDSVFDSFPVPVPPQYGGFDIEAMIAHGGLIASAQAMLTFGNGHEVFYPNIGTPVTTSTSHSNRLHTGALTGTSTALWPWNDTSGTVIYVAFNQRNGTNGDSMESKALTAVNALIAAGGFTWPTATCDGFWVSAGSGGGDPGKGGYHAPYRGFANAMAETTTGSRLRLKPGNSAWSGTMSRQLRLDAPEGAARIGTP